MTMKARSGTDVVDARCPGTVIGLVVLGSEWLQAEARTNEALRNDKVIRDEGLSHAARLPRHAPGGPDLPGPDMALAQAHVVP